MQVLTQLFGHKKTYKVENQLLVGCSERREGWATARAKARVVTPFPAARRGGPYKLWCDA